MYDEAWLLQTAQTHMQRAGGRTALELTTLDPVQGMFLGLSEDAALSAGRFTLDLAMGTGGRPIRELGAVTTVRAFGRLVRFACDEFAEEHPSVLIDDDADVEAATKGIVTGLMQPGLFKTAASEGYYPGPETVSVTVRGDQDRVRRGIALGGLANLQRFLGACPLNVLNVATYAELVFRLTADNPNVSCSRLSDAELERMGLLSAVCRGSGRVPTVIVLRVDPANGPTEQVDAIIGKGLVFDDGGEQIKVTPHMRSMHTDMMGSAAALSVALYFADHRKELERSLLCVLVMAENRIGPNAYMIEDILTAYDGRTVQVHNTDAEGRLVLADAVAYLCANHTVRRLTTIATLTGHAVTVCGKGRSALMVRGNDATLTARLVELADAAADPVQPLILEPGDAKAMRSEVADVKNVSGSPERGAQNGATFIHAFVPADVPEVVHLDIAPVCDDAGRPYLAAGLPAHGGVWNTIEWHCKRD